MREGKKMTINCDEALKLVEQGHDIGYEGRLFELASSGSNKWLEWEKYYRDGSHTTCVWTKEDGNLEVTVY